MIELAKGREWVRSRSHIKGSDDLHALLALLARPLRRVCLVRQQGPTQHNDEASTHGTEWAVSSRQWWSVSAVRQGAKCARLSFIYSQDKESEGAR